MLKWRESFDRKILERGRDSFKDQAVWGLTRGAGGWEAVVIGTEMYPVEIALDGGTVSRTECACPYAEKGHRCKHMAAVLYTLEARWPEVLEDRDEALAGKMEEWSSEEVELALKLAIDVRSMRCTALLLNRSDGNNHFSPDEFTLDDLPEEFGQTEKKEQQGKNDPLLFLFPDASAAKLKTIRKKYGL